MLSAISFLGAQIKGSRQIATKITIRGKGSAKKPDVQTSSSGGRSGMASRPAGEEREFLFPPGARWALVNTFILASLVSGTHAYVGTPPCLMSGPSLHFSIIEFPF